MGIRTTPTVRPFTAEWLVDLGFDDLPTDAFAELLDHLSGEFELRVGAELARQLTESQLDEFEEMMLRRDEDTVLEWLGATLPGYHDDVAHQRRQLEAELRADAHTFVAALRVIGR